MAKSVEFVAYDGRVCLLSMKEIRRGFARGRRQAEGSKIYEKAMREEVEKIKLLMPRLGHRVPLRGKGVSKRGKRSEEPTSTVI